MARRVDSARGPFCRRNRLVDTVQQFCEESIFPAMAAAGVTMPMGVTFNFSDEREEFGPVWMHACSKRQ